VGVVEGGGERAEGGGLPHGVRVGERDDVAAGGLDGGVLGAHLAAAGELEHEIGAGGAGALGGGVDVAVDGDDDLEPVARPVERSRVGDLGGDDRLLAVGGDDEGDDGLGAGRAPGGRL